MTGFQSDLLKLYTHHTRTFVSARETIHNMKSLCDLSAVVCLYNELRLSVERNGGKSAVFSLISLNLYTL